MASVQMSEDVLLLDVGDYNGEDLRNFYSDGPIGAGVTNSTGLVVTPSSGLQVQIAPGACFIREPGDGTLYRCAQKATPALLGITPPPASGNPRVDQIVAHVYNGTAPGDSSNQFVGLFEGLDGALSAGASLDNRNGAVDPLVALSTAKSFILLADVLVPAGSTSISSANIRDRRQIGLPGSLPPITSKVEMVALEPSGAVPVSRHTVSGSDYSGRQSAAVFVLRRKIAATNLRWSYWQDTTTPVPNTVSWKAVICDSSGRNLSGTGQVAFSGAAGDVVRVTSSLALPYSGYVFEPGVYIVWFGLGASMSSGHTCYYFGASAGMGTNDNTLRGWGPPSVNTMWANTTGGVTFPASNTILGMTDLGVSGITNPVLPIPLFTLST